MKKRSATTGTSQTYINFCEAKEKKEKKEKKQNEREGGKRFVWFDFINTTISNFL
jgi:hypothetical protein